MWHTVMQEISNDSLWTNVNSKAGAYLGDTVVLVGRVTYVGKTSMEVRIDTYAEDPDECPK